jgi:ketosteroid isomerase-like protein
MSTSKSHEPANRGAVSRRAAIVAAMATPFLMGKARADQTHEAVVSELAKRSELQAQLFNAGEMKRWLEVVQLGEEFTLMQPFGGPASQGFDPSPEHLAKMSAAFRNGTATLELVQAIASDDVVVLAYVERQDGEVHGLPKQDWSLRVTQVFRRKGSAWELVHRHADPLVRGITLQETAALAAGRSLAAVRPGEE